MLLPARLFLAAGWLRAGVEKLIDEHWWSGDEVRSYITGEHDQALPFARPAMRQLLDHGGAAAAVVVLVLEMLCGTALLLGLRLRTALWTGIALNLVFVVTGRVNPSAFYLVLEIVLLFAIAHGLIGARRDGWRPHPVLVAGGWTLAALAMAPFVETMRPAHAIDDPALMLVFLAALVALGQLLGWLLADDTVRPAEHSRWAMRVARWSRGGG